MCSLTYIRDRLEKLDLFTEEFIKGRNWRCSVPYKHLECSLVAHVILLFYVVWQRKVNGKKGEGWKRLCHLFSLSLSLPSSPRASMRFSCTNKWRNGMFSLPLCSWYYYFSFLSPLNYQQEQLHQGHGRHRIVLHHRTKGWSWERRSYGEWEWLGMSLKVFTVVLYGVAVW